MALEVWADNNEVHINPELIQKGNLISLQYRKEHGTLLTEDEFKTVAPKVLGVDPLPDGELHAWKS